MNVTRRNFIKSLPAVAAVAAGSCRPAVPAPQEFSITRWEPGRDEKMTVGTLSDGVLATLSAAVAPALGRKFTADNYTATFRWKAAKRPGYLFEFNQFARAADELSLHLHQRPFASTTDAQRLVVLNVLQGEPMPGVLVEKPVALATQQHIVHEIHLIYARTDGWVALGYENWAGVPRTLVFYPLPPPGALGSPS